MPLAAWMSHWYVYLPFLSLIVQVFVVTAETLVDLFTPGPKRWKLCADDLSRTTILYVPCLSVLTSLPPFVTSMSKPGPLVPTSFGSVIACPSPETRKRASEEATA